jgi:hypothetical protein
MSNVIAIAVSAPTLVSIETFKAISKLKENQPIMSSKED